MSRAILMAAAGTSSPEAGNVFCRLDACIADRFADMPRYWAYTSRGVRRKLARGGRPVDDPAEALRRMRADGVTQAVVKSLHMAPGMEYEELAQAVDDASRAGGDAFQTVLDPPLLASAPSRDMVIRALVDASPAEPTQGDAILFVAHGSKRSNAQHVYAEADAACRRLDRNVFLGTMIPPSNPEAMVKECCDAGIRRVYLVPFMIAAGFSAHTELAGQDDASWQSALEAAGIECRPVLRGLGEYDEVVAVWLDQLESAWARMEAV